MGNTSSTNEDSLAVWEQQPQKESAAASSENLLDFSVLFVTESLHKALLNVTDSPGTPLQVYREQLVKWLEGKVDKSETTVNLVQFLEYLTGKGATKEQAIDAFGELDIEGEGTVDITYFLSELKSTTTRLQDLLPCPHLPNLVDVYCSEKDKTLELAKSLLQHLIRYRVPSDKLVPPALTHINGVLEQRKKLVDGRYLLLEEKQKDEHLLGDDSNYDDDLSDRVIISKCFSKVTVSSNDKTRTNLFDSNQETYWQSNGSPKSHWIRIHLLSGVMVKELAVSVNSSDDSYMPKMFTISVGNSDSSFKLIKTINIPRDTTGRFVLIRNMSNYSLVQIGIKGCHSDGCDCRIRGLHIKGCKQRTKEEEFTVLDTMTIWYLNIIAATAKAAMPLAPQLRNAIIAQSKMSLNNLWPLSLSPSSPSKPDFFSTFVISEMNKFLSTLCLPEENFVSVDSDPLHILMSFAVAHGNVNTILDTLQILLDNLSLEFSLLTLLQRMELIKQRKRNNHAEVLLIKVVSCDGGKKDDDHSPECMLQNQTDSTAEPYISEAGKKVVNLVLCEESSSLLELTNIKVKVQIGDQGPRAGVVFVLNSDPEEELVKQIDKYNDWTMEDYLALQEQRSNGTVSMDELCPVAYFEPDKESNEAELAPDVIRTGKYVLVKFIGSEKEDVDKIGVQYLTLSGYKTSPEGLTSKSFIDELDIKAPLPRTNDQSVQGGVVFIRLLSFLVAMLTDLNRLYQRRKILTLDPSQISEEHLSVVDLSLEKIWSIYIPLTLNPDEQLQYASTLCLHVLKASLPFIKPAKPLPSKTDQSDYVAAPEPMTVPSAVLSHFCGLFDSSETDVNVRKLAHDIIVEGVVIFFPDAKARKEYLLNMIGSVLERNQSNSWWLKFEALCQYFSKTNSNSLLGLPKTVQEDCEVDTAPALHILMTMLAVATKEGLSVIEIGTSKPDELVKLLSALQASLFFWCKMALVGSSEPADKMRTAALDLLSDYVSKLSDACSVLLTELYRKEDMSEALIDSLSRSLLGRALAEMLTFLCSITDLDIRPLDIINKLHPLVPAFCNVFCKAPSIFLKLDSKEIQESADAEAIVGVWTRESPHNYENNSDKSEEFVCSPANRFVIEFDPKCHTERRYDYLEFTDSNGVKTKFDGLYGSEKWARTIEFKGQRLKFHFHSDGSNNEWGYKFTLKAYGSSPPSMNWLFDLQISLSHLLGILASTSLSKKRTQQLSKLSDKTDEQKEEDSLLHSDLWRTLFRGGYMVGKLTRSLSGAYASNPADSALCAALNNLADEPEGVGQQLLELCRAETKGPFYGGPLVDRAVNSIFAALIWHSQDVRDELSPLVSSGTVQQVTPRVLSAFKYAEAMRRDLVEARQKVLQAKESEEDKEIKDKINEDAPVIACHEKSLFLLKFAGLSRERDPPSNPGMRPHWAKKSHRWQKVTNAVSTVGVLKKHLLDNTDRGKASEKYPSFELVMNFVKNESLSVEKLHSLLQEKSKVARFTAQTYNFIADVVRLMGVNNFLFELPGLVFLKQVLIKQKHFPRHYAAQLDGCGLELENSVRKSYRLLLTILLETLDVCRKPRSKELSFSRFLVLLYLTHLLDFEWQGYDFSMLSDLHLPDFLFNSAISCSAKEVEPTPTFGLEDTMMARYEVDMELLKLFNALDNKQTWKSLLEIPFVIENLKAAHLFLVAIAYHSKKITIQCDVCNKAITGRWFRDIDEDVKDDFDLCLSCFEKGEGKSHNADHTFQSIGQFGCDGCGMSILSHRFHSNTRDDFDLCLGCFRKEQASGKMDSWTVFPLTEIAAADQKNKYLSNDTVDVTGVPFNSSISIHLRNYVLQHSWLLFSSICLAMANTVNSNNSSVEVDYLRQASKIKLECLKLLNFSLRATLLDKIDTATEEVPHIEPSDKAVDITANQTDQVAESITVPTEVTPLILDTLATPSETTLPTLDTVAPSSETTPPIKQEENLVMKASRVPREMDSTIGFVEKTFSTTYINNILGLLAAVLPREFNLSAWIQHMCDIEVFLADELLPTLLQLSSCPEVESTVRLQALLVTAQYFAHLNRQVADRAVEIAHGHSPQDVDDVGFSGVKTVQFFFSFGASCLKRSDFAGASVAESCLLLLSRPPTWRSVLTTSMGQCLKNSIEDMDLESVFSLLVLAGFPKVPCAGSILTYSGTDKKPSPLVLVKIEENGKGVAVNTNNRENIYINLSDYEIEDSQAGCIDASKLDSLLPLVKVLLKLIKQECERSVENMWILGLLLKGLQIILQSPDSEGVVSRLLEAAELVPDIVKLASRPTHFSQKWRLTELEVLAISVYQPASVAVETDSPEIEVVPEVSAKTPAEGNKEKEEEEDASAEPVTQSDKDAEVLNGLPEDAQGILQTLCEVFICKMSILRAMYDSVSGDMGKFMEITDQSYKDGEFKPSEEIIEAAKKWEMGSSPEESGEIQHNLDDTGVTKLVPVEVDIRSVEATPEDASVFKKTKNLMKYDSKDSSVKDVTSSTTSRRESYLLLREELSSLKSKARTREDMFKVFQAVAVLQARCVSASLLQRWPKSGVKLSTTTLGCVDVSQYFCLLDLLMKQEGEEILSSALNNTEPTEVVSLAVTAAQCMCDVSVGTETKQIKYKPGGGGEEKMTEKGKVVIPNASSVTITYHPVNGSLKFSSNEDHSEHMKCHISSTFDLEDQHTYTIPGDTVCYEVEMTAPSNKNTICSFTVNGTQIGRFEAGHLILRYLCEDASLKFAHCLPLSKLWLLLIAVACKYIGTRRLGVVRLLLIIVKLQSGSNKKTELSSDVVVVHKDRLELSALKPLWQLYTNLIKNYEEKTKTQQLMSPKIIRVLTELFLCVENLAEEWGISQDLMIRTQTKEELNTWLKKGISNVAYLSIGLGLDNTASQAFIDAKRNYVPPPSLVTKDVDIDDEDDNSSNSFDTTQDEDDDDEDEDTSDSDEDSEES